MSRHPTFSEQVNEPVSLSFVHRADHPPELRVPPSQHPVHVGPVPAAGRAGAAQVAAAPPPEPQPHPHHIVVGGVLAPRHCPEGVVTTRQSPRPWRDSRHKSLCLPLSLTLATATSGGYGRAKGGGPWRGVHVVVVFVYLQCLDGELGFRVGGCLCCWF